MRGYWRYWGKAGPQSSEDAVWHPLVCHSLDVAAVGEVLLREDALLRRRIAMLMEVPEDLILPWLTAVIALHDVGKFAEGFQNLRADLRPQLGTDRSSAPYDVRHDELGRSFLRNSGLATLGIFASQLQSRPDIQEELMDLWMPTVTAVTGHHGRPTRSERPWEWARQFPPATVEDARAFIADVEGLLGCVPIFDLANYECQLAAQRRASWLVAGLTVVADWLGSSTDFFPYRPDADAIGDYWREVARPAARAAVSSARLLPPRISPTAALFTSLFSGLTATPLQEAMSTMTLEEAPQLWIVEEATGGGKTEAALILAGRLLAAGTASGVYVALPTMATANAMFGRVDSLAGRLFDVESSVEVVLAHAHASLAQRMGVIGGSRDGRYAADEPSASTAARSWLSDSRKRALLAHLGVGTIDQALLAVLPAAHQSLRLLGLCRHVLIVDEVHACDVYMLGELRRLLEFQAALGGSAILLSATLPAGVRRALEFAFRRGVGSTALPAASVRASEVPYPLVTVIDAAGTRTYTPASRASCRRRVQVERLDGVESVVAGLVATAETGRCAAWIRNTVDDAIEAWQALSSKLGPDRVTLFHARFALGDRLATEQMVVRRFGKHGDPGDRAGHVVVSTQVLEQSLDVDFDWMVTDLAPMDLVIQRAGRLMRHARDIRGVVHGGPDARGVPRLGLLSPRATADVGPDWPADLLQRTCFVYDDPAILWRTAAWLEAHGGFAVPDDARAAIEAVFGDESAMREPAALAARSDRAEGERHARAGTASQSVLNLAAGYSADGAWFNDENIRTRLGERTVTVRLVRVDADGPRPWCDCPDDVVAWALSEVTVRYSQIALEIEDPAAEAARARMPDEGRDRLLVVLHPGAGGWRGTAQGPRGPVAIRYDGLLGLQFSPAAGSQ